MGINITESISNVVNSVMSVLRKYEGKGEKISLNMSAHFLIMRHKFNGRIASTLLGGILIMAALRYAAYFTGVTLYEENKRWFILLVYLLLEAFKMLYTGGQIIGIEEEVEEYVDWTGISNSSDKFEIKVYRFLNWASSFLQALSLVIVFLPGHEADYNNRYLLDLSIITIAMVCSIIVVMVPCYVISYLLDRSIKRTGRKVINTNGTCKLYMLNNKVISINLKDNIILIRKGRDGYYLCKIEGADGEIKEYKFLDAGIWLPSNIAIANDVIDRVTKIKFKGTEIKRDNIEEYL